MFCRFVKHFKAKKIKKNHFFFNLAIAVTKMAPYIRYQK